MTHPGIADVIRRFNDAFIQRDPDMLVDLVADPIENPKETDR